MDSTRWDRVQALFHDAAELPASDQRAFLESACADDAAIRSDVLAMLRADRNGSSVIDGGVAPLADRLLDETAPASLPCKDFGPYRAIRVLGEGGMGVVCLAERKDVGGLVAVKILRDAWLSPARRERFAAEQRLLAQLNHPAIARLYDANALPDGTPYFVMEYVDGLALTDHCTQYACSLERRLQLFRQVCEAVQYAHSHAVIHRDLKPSNILVKADGSIRLLDFGIAKQLDGMEANHQQTRTGMRLMTPAYAAPEQVRGDQVGVHTDVYALGVVLYELIAGMLPLDVSGLAPLEAATVIATQAPEPPSSIADLRGVSKGAWADLDVLCLKAMHKDPVRRYRSVEAFVRDIDHYLKAEPLEARPDTLAYKLAKFTKRNQRSVTLGVAALVMLVSLVAFFTYRLARARDTALAEAARAQRIQRFTINLFQGGDEAAGPADALQVKSLLARGVQEAQNLGADPGLQSDMFQALGSIYQKLGNLDQADSLLQAALQHRQSLFGSNSPEAAETMVALALLRDTQARYDDAEKLVRQALGIASRETSLNDAQRGRATAALGKILENRGEYKQAIPVLQEAVRLQSQPEANEADLAASMSELANCHFYLGAYQMSELLNRQVLQLQQRLYGPSHPMVADTLINLGAIQYELGNYRQAERFDREALQITQSWCGKDHPETASAMTILARALVPQKGYEEASSLLEQAVSVQEHVYGPVHPRVASALNELGKVAQSRGNLDVAEQAFRRMADIYRSVYGEHHYLLAVAMSNLGSVYLERKRYPQAEQVFREALQRFTETLSPTHLNTAIAHIKLGRALLRQRRFDEAETESRTGYGILSSQANPSVIWLKNARTDLAQEYEALKKPEQAAMFRVDQASAAAVNVANVK